MSKKSIMLTQTVMVLMVAVSTLWPCQVICGAEEDQSLDNTQQLFTSFDLLGQQQQQQNPSSDLIRFKPSRLADLCQLLRYQAFPYRTADMRKRGYMGIEIPDFITSQDGTQQQGTPAGGPKPRYYKNG